MNNVEDCIIVDLPQVYRSQGSLTALEGGINIPFDIQRVYYLYDVPNNSTRGGHAHYELQQYVIATSGSFTMMLDDGRNKKEFFLNTPLKALYIKPGIWREMKNFSSGSVCLVLASLLYDEKDYIRSYQDFLTYRSL